MADATPLRLFTDIASFQMLLGELSAQEGRHDEALGLYFPALRALQNAECRPLAAGAAMQSAKSLAALGRRDEAQAQLALASALMAAFLPEGNRHRRGLAAELAALTAP